jgi:alkaline phosphatase D
MHMMPRILHCLSLAILLLPSAAAPADEPLSRIAFGSCVQQGRPQPIWQAVVAQQPQAFLFIGDNIYGDTLDMDVLRAKYQQLGREPGFLKLKSICPVLATWDDHDYGKNDAGADYPKKKESQQAFLDFFGEPTVSPRRKREGVYNAKVFGPEGKRVQCILLDTRYFRSPLIKAKQPRGEPGEGHPGEYVPNDDPESTVLGDAQWNWLAEQLGVPAEVRIIASSIQVIANEHGWEKWGNFPHERKRLFQLIADTKASGVLFISGDRHSAEISALDPGVGYKLYDVTSSAMNQRVVWHNELNPYRLGTKYVEPNFGTILINWSEADPTIRLQVRDVQGKVVLQHRAPLSELRKK